MLSDGLNWLCYFASSLNSHREDSIAFIFLESTHQVDTKNVVKSWKDTFVLFHHSINIPCLRLFAFTEYGRPMKAPFASVFRDLAQVIYKPYCHYQNFTPLANGVYLIAIYNKNPVA